MRLSIKHPASWFGTLFVLALIISYLGLAWIYQSLFLFDKVVHEDGQQTFLGLLFNPSHFLREIPISLLSCVGVVGSFLFLSPVSSRESQSRNPGSRGRLYGWLAGAIVLVAILSTALSKGIHSVWYELAQYKTRGETLAYGSHWYNHFLHVLFIPVEALGACSFLRWAYPTPCKIDHNPSKRLLSVWMGGFLLLWLVFGFKWSWATEPLALAHQLREIGTHGILSLSLILGVCFYMEARTCKNLPTAEKHTHPPSLKLFWSCLVLSLVILGFLLWRLRSIEVLELAQKQAGYLELFFSHNFEHFIDYLFMALVTAGLFYSFSPHRSSEG